MKGFGAAILALVLSSAPAAAQARSRPGPWVLDVRGVTSPVPEEPAFYPPLDSSALMPQRGFGFDVGAHIYLFNLRNSRVGVGATVVNVRSVSRPPREIAAPGSTTPSPPRQAVLVELLHIAPQLSFNFGTRDGWSYVSAGFGPSTIDTATEDVSPDQRETGRLNAINFGGGARWFLKSRLAFGFDMRFYRLDRGTAAPTPRKQFLTVGAGFSIR